MDPIVKLELEAVRDELETLINEYPDRYGTTNGEDPNEDYSDSTCVYYLDGSDMQVPVCIVGTWIERFHPELKEIPAIRSELITNVGVASWNDVEELLPDDVTELLLTAQMQQDVGKKWGQIDLDKASILSRYGG